MIYNAFWSGSSWGFLKKLLGVQSWTFGSHRSSLNKWPKREKRETEMAPDNESLSDKKMYILDFTGVLFYFLLVLILATILIFYNFFANTNIFLAVFYVSKVKQNLLLNANSCFINAVRVFNLRPALHHSQVFDQFWLWSELMETRHPGEYINF